MIIFTLKDIIVLVVILLVLPIAIILEKLKNNDENKKI